MKHRNLYIFIILVFVLSSCAYRGTIVKNDHDELSCNRKVPEVYYDGQSLEIVVKQVAGLNLAKITTKIYEGYLYLDPLYISSGGERQQTFFIDFEKEKLKDSWDDQVYWITGESYPAPLSWLNPFRDHNRKIFRKKLKIIKK